MNKIFFASMDQLRNILQSIRQEIHKAGFKGPLGSQLELALEEAVVNIIKHAYPEPGGKINIKCESLEKNEIKVILIDNGIPFNPANVSKTNLEDMKKGQPLNGYGIFLIFKIMDTVEYEFKEGCNVLTLIKKMN